MLNLEQIAIDAVKNVMNSDALKEAIEKKITETITSEITDTFRSYSPFAKAFEAAIKEQMKIDLDNIGFMEYNHFVATTIKKKFMDQLGKPTEEQIGNMVNEVLQLQAETVTLESILDDWRNSKTEYDPNQPERFAFFVSRGKDSWNNGKITFHFDEDSVLGYSSERKASNCDYSLTISMDTKKVIGFDLGCGGSKDDAKIKRWRHALESNFFRMYASGTVIDLENYEDLIIEMMPGDVFSANDIDADSAYTWFTNAEY